MALRPQGWFGLTGAGLAGTGRMRAGNVVAIGASGSGVSTNGGNADGIGEKTDVITAVKPGANTNGASITATKLGHGLSCAASVAGANFS